MNIASLKASVKAAAILLAHEAEEQIVGEKRGPERKAWVLAKIKEVLTNAGVYGKKLFGVFSLDAIIDSALNSLVEWAAAKLKTGFDALEKL